MKYFILLFIVGALTACGSSPKKDSAASESDSSGLDGPPVTSSAPETKSIDQADAQEKTPEPVKRETPSNAYAPLSQAYKSQNEEAIYRSAVQILSQNPADAKALNALGLYHYRKGRFLAARYFFSRAQAASPRSGEIYNNQGLVSLSLDEEKDAIRSFKKALDLNPEDGIAAANLGSIYVQHNDYGKAAIALELAVKKGMHEVRTMNNYGIALTATGKFDQAKKVYEEVLRTASNSQETLLNYAILLIDQMKQYPEGLDQLNRLKFLGPAQEIRNKMNALENKAKAGIK